MKNFIYHFAILISLISMVCACGISTPNEISRVPAQYKKEVSKALVVANHNQNEILKVLDSIPEDYLNDLCFLLINMPERDLKELNHEFLYNNIEQSRLAWENSLWKNQVPYPIYLNNILPYASVNERRDDYKENFYDQFHPFIKDCKTPGEAAVVLNNQIWDILNVHYSTKRPKADQSPYESIDASMASCTGLSILLIDVCRSVGIPMRFVGAPKWVNVPGNHSWVEVWDNGGWHFLGAWEPGPLDETWFEHRAAFADSTNSLHSIYATSFKKTGLLFPTVWDSTVNYVHATNVSTRYAKVVDKSERIEIAVRVYDKNSGDRVTASVEVWANGEKQVEGKSKDELHDTNDVLSFSMDQEKEIEVRIKYMDRIQSESYMTTDMRVQILDIHI